MKKLKCSKCKKEKRTGEFHTKKCTRGFSYNCKECTSIKNKKRHNRLTKIKKIKVKEKNCSICSIMRSIDKFPKDKSKLDGHRGVCKKCLRSQYYKKLGKEIPRKAAKGQKICSKCNKEKPLDDFYNTKYNPSGKKSNCKACDYKRLKKWKNENKDKISSNNKKWRKGNKGYNTQYYQNRKETDDVFRTKTAITANIKATLKYKGIKKSKRTHKILKCTVGQFKKYIESQWENWMNWDNYGKYNGNYKTGWDLDHIIPISYANTEEEVYELNHWSNFQPLCSKVNRDVKKANLYPVSNLELNLTVT